MTPMTPVYNNSRGTTSKRFRIGKRGFDILYSDTLPPAEDGEVGDWCFMKANPPKLLYRGNSDWIEKGTRDVIFIVGSQTLNADLPSSCFVCEHSGNITLTLPEHPKGYVIIVKDGNGVAQSDTITVQGDGVTIDNNSQVVLSENYSAITLLSIGTEGYIIV